MTQGVGCPFDRHKFLFETLINSYHRHQDPPLNVRLWGSQPVPTMTAFGRIADIALDCPRTSSIGRERRRRDD